MMVEVTVQNGAIHIEVLGNSRMLAFKRTLDIPIRCVERAVAGPPGLPSFRWTDLRLGGTGVPGRIAAGTYYMGRPHRWTFLDLRQSSENVLVLELKDYRYGAVMVEVADVQKTLQLIQGAMATAGAQPAE
jgi:hypothetical protein